MTTRVKICGITRPEDAMLAAALGVSAVGFVFWPGSPRLITPDAARRIGRALRSLVPLGRCAFCDPLPLLERQVIRHLKQPPVQVAARALEA